MKPLDDTAFASHPCKLTLCHQKLRKLHPKLRLIERLFLWLFGPNFRSIFVDHLMRGDSRAAVVVSTSPLLVAAYTDELDCVAMLRFPDSFVREYNLSVGARLLTVNCYTSDNRSVDLIIGPAATGQWGGFHPIVAEFVSNDISKIEARKAAISEDEWQRAFQMGKDYLSMRPGIFRDGSPILSKLPAGSLESAASDESSTKAKTDVATSRPAALPPPLPAPIKPIVSAHQPKVHPANFAGFGTGYHGESNFRSDGSFVTTEWFVFAFIPVLPLGSHRLLRLPQELPDLPIHGSDDSFGSPRRYMYLERVPLNLPQVIRVYCFLPFLVTFDWLVINVPGFFATSWGEIWFPQERLVLILLMFFPIIWTLLWRYIAKRRAGVDAFAVFCRLQAILPPHLRPNIDSLLPESLSISQIMQLYAFDIVNMTKERLGCVLDYSETSLETIDTLMTAYSGGKILVEAEMTDEQRDDLWIFCKGIAGYVGQVMIRNLGGQWIQSDAPDHALRLQIGNLILTPADSIIRRFTEEFKGGATSYYRATKSLLFGHKPDLNNHNTAINATPLTSEPKPNPVPPKK